ncbi:hypothetical protein [Hyphomicrobium sp. ghe19]|uniref:hypothetical protein n=1 Tax=Hyphomicrobium sp. ghe19 TaxID=2682968 RepID=UPI0013675A82|nr:hypothetical protein HYPP_03835 [Hyphomicrobium sp. ghe19]
MTYRSLYWDDNGARLKNFSGAAKSGAVSVVKIEIEVSHPFRFASLLQDLAEIRRDQDAPENKPASTPAPKRAAARRAIACQPPLLLTHRRD